MDHLGYFRPQAQGVTGPHACAPFPLPELTPVKTESLLQPWVFYDSFGRVSALSETVWVLCRQNLAHLPCPVCRARALEYFLHNCFCLSAPVGGHDSSPASCLEPPTLAGAVGGVSRALPERVAGSAGPWKKLPGLPGALV